MMTLNDVRYTYLLDSNKLFTADETLVVYEVGSLKSEKFNTVIDSVVDKLRK